MYKGKDIPLATIAVKPPGGDVIRHNLWEICHNVVLVLRTWIWSLCSL